MLTTIARGYISSPCILQRWLVLESYLEVLITVKPVLYSHSKIDKTKVLKPCGSLMQVKSTAECSMGAFCNTFDLHLVIIGLENLFLVFFRVAA